MANFCLFLSSGTSANCVFEHSSLILHSHQKLSCLKSGVEFDMNDILNEFKYLHHF